LIEYAVLEGFGEVGGRDGGTACQVGDRARHAAHARDGARRQSQAPGRPLERLNIGFREIAAPPLVWSPVTPSTCE